MDRIVATFRLRAPRSEVAGLAEYVCIEQTAEAHPSLVQGEFMRTRILGQVESLVEKEDGVHEARISFDPCVTAWQIPQLLHVLYGNISLRRGIRLSAVNLPSSFLGRFPGPGRGIDGIREMTGVRSRPLLAAALKPMGLSPDDLAERAYALARGGLDIIKDDHGLADHEFCPFEERVSAVCRAMSRARDETGRRTLYFPSLTDRFDVIRERAGKIASLGADGILTSPLVVGLDTMRWLAGPGSQGLALMAHPALSGTFFSDPDHGISMEVILGTLLRLAGADFVIFPSHGGRFPVARGDCMSLASVLRGPMAGLRPSWPMPAGGLDVDGVPRLLEDYGKDTVLLVGSNLYTRSPDLVANARYFLSLVQGSGG